ncbi:MAG: hypothetical protein QOG03_2259 [Actinomycetota bacterium]|nr:hypothetical protein [Actinomycetota bacterium]
MVALPAALASPLASLVVRAVGFWKVPDLRLSAEQAAHCEALADGLGGGRAVETGPVGAYDFLRWLADDRPVLFHGSGRADLTELHPIRMSSDATAFGNQQAVYATDDPVWAAFFAVVDRGVPNFQSMRNGSITVLGRRPLGPRYYLSINERAARPEPLRDGWVYIVDRAGFASEPPEFGVIHTAQWVRADTVPILGKVLVTAEDFPFRGRLLAHRADESELRTYVKLALRRQ